MPYFEYFNLILKVSDGSEISFEKLGLHDICIENHGFILNTHFTDVLRIAVKRIDNQPFEVLNVSYDFDLPLKNFNRFVVPDCGRYYNRYFSPLISFGRTISMVGGNHGNPFAAFMDHHDHVILAIGIIGQMVELGFTVDSPGRSVRNTLVVDHGRFRFHIDRPAGKFQFGEFTSFEESLFISEGDTSWFHALRSYADSFYQLKGKSFEILEPAFYPTWCSWVPWNSDDLNEEKILTNARSAVDLGIRTVIIDDGWYGPGCDSASLESNMGDYRPDPKKFPNLRVTVEKIHALGLQTLLWVAPLAVSPEAECFEQVKGLLMVEDGKYWKSPSGFHDLCPCCPEARRVILEKIPELLAYGFDGLKVDLYNNIGSEPCTADHEHDCETTTQGVMRLMEKYWLHLKQIKPDAIMESKNNYANVYSSQFGSMTRGGDSPYDINNNFWNCVYPRAYSPVVHNDYLSWTDAETEHDLAILMIKQITAGVPTLSVDLPSLPEAQRKVIKGWLGLYNQYLDVLVRGILEPQTGAMDVWMTRDKDTAIISLLHSAREFTWPVGAKNVVVLNATSNESIYTRIPKPTRTSQLRLNHFVQKQDHEIVEVMDKRDVRISSAGVSVFTLID